MPTYQYINRQGELGTIEAENKFHAMIITDLADGVTLANKCLEHQPTTFGEDTFCRICGATYYIYETCTDSAKETDIEAARISLGQTAQLRGKCPGPLRPQPEDDIFKEKNPTERAATCKICGMIH